MIHYIISKKDYKSLRIYDFYIFKNHLIKIRKSFNLKKTHLIDLNFILLEYE